MGAALYTLDRDGQRYGPYTLEDLRLYETEGFVQGSDLVWTSGMPSWMPVSQVLVGREVFAPGPLASPWPDGPGAGVRNPQTVAAAMPRPPRLHWGWLLLLYSLTLGLMSFIWPFVQARWVKKIDRNSNATLILAIGIPLSVMLSFASGFTAASGGDPRPFQGLAWIIAFATVQTAYFSMRSSMEEYFHPYLQLNGLMTFFFNVLYFQYHMRRWASGNTPEPSIRP
jgi:hypothetical protein